MWSYLSRCRGPWQQRQKPVGRPEQRWIGRWNTSFNFLLISSNHEGEGMLKGNICRNNNCLSVFQIIAAEGEMKASRALKEASLVIAESPSALQLRYLQTLNTIAAEKNSTIIFPLPIDVLQNFMQRKWRISQSAIITKSDYYYHIIVSVVSLSGMSFRYCMVQEA